MVKSDKTKFLEKIEAIKLFIYGNTDSKIYTRFTKYLEELKELFLTQESMSKDNLTENEIITLAKAIKLKRNKLDEMIKRKRDQQRIMDEMGLSYKIKKRGN